MLEEAEEDILAFYAFPLDHCPKTQVETSSTTPR